MPKIRSSADLRNSYNEISTFCHKYAEPVFMTKNGKGDLAVMSIEAYECILMSSAAHDAMQSVRCAEHNGRPERLL